MSLTLTSDDFARCEAVSRTMLSPLRAPSVDDWRREVNRTLRALLRADTALFALPGVGPYFLSDELGANTLGDFQRYVADAAQHRGVSPDPLVDLFYRNWAVRGVDVLNPDVIDQLVDHRLRESVFYNEVMVPSHTDTVHGVMTTTPYGEASVGVCYDRADAMPFGQDSLLLLRVVLPAFRAGVEAVYRFQAHREALDSLREPLAMFDTVGRELHRNASLTRLLDADPEQERVLAELRYMARTLIGVGFPRRNPAPSAAPERVVRTRQAGYRLQGIFLEPGAFSADSALLITVTTDAGPALPAPEVLRERYGLTRREAEVALLLAEGLSNDELADRLFISPHTARRHTEHVLDKLGLSSRKALALRLMQGVEV